MIEVLIVIAITVVLFGLLVKPLIDTLRYTKDAQLEAAAQDSARKTMEILDREIGSAAYVYDNTSHPRPTPVGYNGTTVPNGVPPIQYTNFIDIDVPTFDNSGNVTGSSEAHAYDAKLDIVMGRHQGSSNSLVDPTAGNQPISIQSQGGGALGSLSGSVVTPTPLQFPLGPGVTVIRYFIARINPELPYANPNDSVDVNNADPNTYVLYRAEMNPSLPATSGPSRNMTVYQYFDTDHNGQPIIDDPDFFRYVNVGDPRWTYPDAWDYSPSGQLLAYSPYDAAQATVHNTRVDAWRKIATAIISAPQIDLLELPHNPNRSINYDSATGAFPGIAHFGADYDPLSGQQFPVERMSITFAPGSAGTDVAPSTNTDYASIGIAGGSNGATSGLPYIPSVYQSTNQAWTRPYTIYLDPFKTQNQGGHQILFPITGAALYITQATSLPSSSGSFTPNTYQPVYDLTPGSATTSPFVAGGTTIPISVGDVVEYAQQSLASDMNVIPCNVNEDSGVINFATPGLPDPTVTTLSPSHPFERFWIYPVGNIVITTPNPPNAPTTTTTEAAETNGTDTIVNPDRLGSPGNLPYNQIDLTQPCPMNLDWQQGQPGTEKVWQSPLNNMSGAPDKILNYAFLVPGSLRVYGPDTEPGPGAGLSNAAAPTPTPASPVIPPYSQSQPTTINQCYAGEVAPGLDQIPQNYVLYKEVSQNTTPTGNEYQVDYKSGVLTFDNTVTAGSAMYMYISYDYQANMRPTDTTSPITATNPANPMAVQVIYHSRNSINVNIGVRYIDSLGNSQNRVLSNTVTVGNMNR